MISKTKQFFGALLFVMCLGAASLRAQTTVFDDQFNAGAWDGGKWTTYGTDRYLQRTQFGNAPLMATEGDTKFARFPLKTYNGDPRYSGSYLRGTEVFSNTTFSVGSGLEFEARIRGNNLPRGIVHAFVTYNERGTWPSTYLRDEIDFEFLTNFAKNTMWLNIWDDWNPERGGPNKATQTTAAGLDRSGWHTYKIRWLPKVTEWYVDGVMVRQSLDILPNDPMSIHLNIWAASSDWAAAYDANLPVTAVPSESQNFYMDVDWVQVRTVAGPVVGTGTGLTGKYFDNKDFTGGSIERVDPQVNFEWGNAAPASQIGADTFSTRWTGQVQPQYSEEYTFTTRADDGVRLWVNNQLLVDRWTDSGPVENSGKITLVAGQKYDIKMEYYENAGGAVAQLSWASAHTPKTLVPKTQLYPTSAAENTPPTITVTSPVNNRLYAAAPLFSGVARDAETSVLALSGLLYDQTRLKYWSGAAWTATPVNFPVAQNNGNWSYQLPNLIDGRYTLRLAAVDTERKASSTALVFSINNKKPPVIVIESPVANRVYPSKPAFRGTARDAETSILEVRGMIYDGTRKVYWNGSAWGATAVYFLMNGKESWSYTMPALQNGNYVARVLASDTWHNSSTTAVGFTVKSGASTVTVAPEVSSATARGDKITLAFTGKISASSWLVTVNGDSVAAAAAVTGDSVTLTLPGQLKRGDDVTVEWQGGAWSGKAQ